MKKQYMVVDGPLPVLGSQWSGGASLVNGTVFLDDWLLITGYILAEKEKALILFREPGLSR